MHLCALAASKEPQSNLTVNRSMKRNVMRPCLHSIAFVLLVGVGAAAIPVSAQGGADASSAKIFKGYALTELSAAGLLYNAKAKEIYYKALGPLVKEPWLAKLDGPSSEGKAMKIAGADYVMLYTCKERDCYENNVVLLWSGVQNVVYGKVYQRGRSTLIGSPPPAVAAELETLWKKQFRSQPK